MSKRTLALGLSLMLNALLIGFIVGDLARPIRSVMSLSAFTTHYPPEIRAAIRSEVIAGRRGILDGLRAFNSARVEMTAEMRAAEPDPARVAEVQGEIRRITADVQRRLQEATLAGVLSVSPEVRARIAEPGETSGERLVE